MSKKLLSLLLVTRRKLVQTAHSAWLYYPCDLSPPGPFKIWNHRPFSISPANLVVSHSFVVLPSTYNLSLSFSRPHVTVLPPPYPLPSPYRTSAGGRHPGMSCLLARTASTAVPSSSSFSIDTSSWREMPIWKESIEVTVGSESVQLLTGDTHLQSIEITVGTQSFTDYVHFVHLSTIRYR